MRIAVEASWLNDPTPTGIGVYAHELLHALVRIAPEHRYLLLFHGKQWNGDDYGPSCEPVPYYAGKKCVALATVFPRLLRRVNADLLHGIFTSDAPRTSPVPVAVTVHDLFPATRPEGIPLAQRLLFRLQFGWAVRNAGLFFANSTFTKDELIRAFGVPPERIVVTLLGPGANPPDDSGDGLPDAPSPQPSPARGEGDGQSPSARPAEAPSIPSTRPSRQRQETAGWLCLGAIEARKGQVALLKAYALAREKNPALGPLIFAGPDRGDGKALLRERRALGLEGAVRWEGFLDWRRSGDWRRREEMIRDAVAVLVPSFAEGFGLPVAEAMARGRPVIASSIPPFEEVAGDAARYAPPGDAGAWADAILAFARDAGERDRLAALGRARAAKFTWDACARQTLEGYERLLK